MLEVLKNNKRAIYELENQGDEAFARDLLRKNVKQMPSCTTLNNLGVYYSQYGMLLKNGKVRSAKKLGLRNLLKASVYGEDWRNYISAATAALECDDIGLAYQLFLKAYHLNEDKLILYNVAGCLYWLKEYEESLKIFELLREDSSIEYIIQNEGRHPLLALAYCENMLCNKKKSAEYLKMYQEQCDEEDLWDVFCLRYLCGMYEEALAGSRELLKKWCLSTPLLAMLADCIDRNSSVPIQNMEIQPEKEGVWNLLRRDPEFRDQQIKELSTLPHLIYMYRFIDD